MQPRLNEHIHTQTSLCHIIPESSWSMESSWNIWKYSGRKAMLSRLGGAVITSSGPAFSLDSRAGNSRQDETHPDTLTAQLCLLWQLRLKFCPEYCPPQAFFFFFCFLFFLRGPLVIKTFERTKEAAGFRRFQNWLHLISVTVPSALLLIYFPFKETKVKNKPPSSSVPIDSLISLDTVV